jgi:hypothetical protein
MTEPTAAAGALEAARAAALAAACPIPTCAAPAGQPCRYASRAEDMETGEPLHPLQPVWVYRTAHLERVALHTDGALFGYTLRALQRDTPKWRLALAQQRALYPGLDD